MRLFVERVDDHPTRSGHRVALLDTSSIEANRRLEQIRQTEVDHHRPQSMLELEFQSPPHQGLREGFWYDIDETTFRDFTYTPVGEGEPGQHFLRARMTEPTEKIAFSLMRGAHDYVQLADGEPPGFNRNPTNLELVVVDCGQGNWNEIRSTQDRIIYDIGADRNYTTAQVQTLVTQSGIGAENRPVHLIISHWDIDHYQSLLCCGPAELGVIRSVTAPSQLPNTQTFRRVQALLAASNVAITALPPATRPAGTGRRVTLCPEPRIGPYQVYRAVTGSSRNQTGIALSVDGTSLTAILTGDHHYDQILQAVSASSVNSKAVMVVPHHGGRAGSIDVGAWRARFPALTTPISVGASNPYGHPFASVVRDLTSLQGGKAPAVTSQPGGLTYPL